MWHLQTDQSLADSWSVSPRRGFSHLCAEAWQPCRRSHPCRHTMAPGPARERLSQTGQEALGQPPAPRAWTRTSFLYYFLFPSLVQRAAGSFPPSLPDPNPAVSWPPNHCCSPGVCTLHLPFLSRSHSFTTEPLPHRYLKKSPQTDINRFLKKTSLSQEKASQKTQKNERHAASRLLTLSGSGFLLPGRASRTEVFHTRWPFCRERVSLPRARPPYPRDPAATAP